MPDLGSTADSEQHADQKQFVALVRWNQPLLRHDGEHPITPTAVTSAFSCLKQEVKLGHTVLTMSNTCCCAPESRCPTAWCQTPQLLLRGLQGANQTVGRYLR